MASAPIGPDSGSVTLPNQFPPMPAVARILARFDRDQLHGFIAVAIDLADAMEGNPDAEDDDPAESGGDDRDAAWIEWPTMRASHKKGPNILTGHEDDETVGAEDDFPPNGGSFTLGRGWPAGAGCPVADPDEGIDDKGHDDINDDREHEEDCHPTYGIDQTKGQLPPTMTPDQSALRRHLNRIRETRCEKITYGGTNGGTQVTEYRLKD